MRRSAARRARTWEGGVRVPMLVKWPGKIKPGSVSNGIQNHEDLFATLAAAAGLPDLKEELLKPARRWASTTYKVHLDGYNNLDHWTGKSEKSARREIFYYDETDLMALARRRLEDAHRREARRELVEREVLPERPVPLQSADGPDGEDGPGVARVGLHRAQVLRHRRCGRQRPPGRSSPRTSRR